MAKERSYFCKNPACLGLGSEWTECCHNHMKPLWDLRNWHSKGFQVRSSRQSFTNFPRVLGQKIRQRAPNGLEKSEFVKRSKKFLNKPVPDNLLQITDESILSLWLFRYVVETRNAAGEPYSSATTYQVLSALLRSVRFENPACKTFLDKKNPEFKIMHGTLNPHFRKLHESEVLVGTKVKHAEIISKKRRQWDSGVMGATSPSALAGIL